MNRETDDGARRQNPVQIPLPDGSVLLRFDEDDPEAVVDTSHNTSDLAYPPKSDTLNVEPHDELIDLMNAMTAFKRTHGLPCLLWNDVLDVLHDMGYRRTAPPTHSAGPPAPEPVQ
jgi:hypothetical protein